MQNMAQAAETLHAMGFPGDMVAEAIRRHKGVEQALEWLLSGDVRAAGSARVRPREQAAEGGASAAASATSSSRARKRTQEAADMVDVASGDEVSHGGSSRRLRMRRKAPGPTGGSSSHEAQVNEEAVACSICTDDWAPGQALRLPCGHGWYCCGCLQRFAEVRLEEGRHEVPCPECGQALGQGLLRAVLPQRTLDRLLERSLEQAVSASSSLWPCPTPDCPHRVALEEGQAPCLQCPRCRRESCLRCHASPYHHGRTCEEHAARGRRASGSGGPAPERSDEDLLREWMKKTGTRQCPRCQMAITKEDLSRQLTQRSECHKMICRNCETRFCFKCLKVLTGTTTCGCTGDNHGFINPKTGRFVSHLRRPHA